MQYMVPENLALLPFVTDVVTGNFYSRDDKANVNLLAAILTTM